MEVINRRAALLSNYEVLSLLRELESDHLEKAKTAQRVKKEEEVSGQAPRPPGSEPPFGEPSENLRTVEVEAIQYLSADYLPTKSQTPEGITKLVKGLGDYGLTTAEKLQVVNLAPTLPVELYVIVEELEDRLGDRMGEILTHVQSALPAASSTVAFTNGGDSQQHSPGLTFGDNSVEQWDNYVYQEEGEEVIFDDTGEGAGIEGDLDMDDD